MRTRTILFLFFLFFSALNIAFSQQKEEDRIILTADEQIFDMKNNVLMAYRNVKIKHRNFLITAKEAQYEKEKNQIKIRGNVIFLQDNISLVADEMMLDIAEEKIATKGNVNFTDKDRKINLFAEELLSRQNEKIIIAKEKVRIKKEDLEGEGDIVEIYLDEDRAKLTGKAKVQIDNSLVSANILNISFSDKKIKAEGEVTVIAYPNVEKK